MINNYNIFHKSKSRSSKNRLNDLDLSLYPNKNFLSFGETYFDGPKGLGYGGYKYDSRFESVVELAVNRYQLKNDSKILELGCAKGFVLYEFFIKGYKNITGIDISHYAINNCPPEIAEFLIAKNLNSLNFKQKQFDFIFSKEVLPHLNIEELNLLIPKMIKSVINPKNISITIQVAQNLSSKQAIMRHDPTHRTLRTKQWWISFFNNVGYKGDLILKELF